jgi:hypothetical protein
MKQLKILFTLLVLALAGKSLACPEETVTIRPYHLRTIKGTIEPPDGGNYDELKINFVVQERDTDRTWKVPVHSNGDFLLVLPKGEYNFTIRVEQFLHDRGKDHRRRRRGRDPNCDPTTLVLEQRPDHARRRSPMRPSCRRLQH